MKTLRRISATTILSLTLTASVLAGHIETPGAKPPSGSGTSATSTTTTTTTSATTTSSTTSLMLIILRLLYS